MKVLEIARLHGGAVDHASSDAWFRCPDCGKLGIQLTIGRAWPCVNGCKSVDASTRLRALSRALRALREG
jgi:hypothetical protein